MEAGATIRGGQCEGARRSAEPEVRVDPGKRTTQFSANSSEVNGDDVPRDFSDQPPDKQVVTAAKAAAENTCTIPASVSVGEKASTFKTTELQALLTWLLRYLEHLGGCLYLQLP